ncbi:Repeat domain-containing protein [Aquimarina amphilecti]|uniref:Repeat domain-containing protein n=1 Tax=Aquimarina amphilecti TaxID=1038014 RepID=A0A1H7RTQ4_AQUAM|nr:VCBS repeat-containing protein [Aquimarina amphilecti]SEL63388.1 Repeat domain-containing protein [Aquimarina amphilecti]
MANYFRNISCSLLLVVVIISCKKDKELYFFELLSEKETGISFRNDLRDTPELNILTYLYYYNGAGIAISDFNNDGWEDVFFVSNQNENQLYLNQKNFQFKEVTSDLLKDNNGWSTGVIAVDINNDGLQDIYVCKVGDYKNIKGRNKLFVNQGLDNDGIPIFKEQASLYNLDISSFSTQSVFFDYDLDGDLDMYLLNHSVYPNRSYGRGSKRNQVDSLSGDKLYRNDNGKYYDVSVASGIFQGGIGYGLGITVEDINNDRYPDIYIGNDFFENDYLYINQKNGTFKEVITSNSSKIQHTSHYSMGTDIADINNDGWSDILSLDMLPEDLSTYKSSGTEYGFTIYNQYLKNGYQPQYMQNGLQLNRRGENFSEIAFFSGIAATEWSWAPLIADYDNDGLKDVFISNGIKGATNDMDFISFIANDNIQKRIDEGMTKEDLALIDELPNKKTSNYFYRNKGDLTFENVSNQWSKNLPSYSNGAVYADLDNDGDLDIVTNNIDENAFVYENRADTLMNHNYIRLKLKGVGQNLKAIGAKATVFTRNGLQTSSVNPVRGYLSSVGSTLHFGLGDNQKIDSIQVAWPNGDNSIYKNVKINTITSLIQDSTNVLSRTFKKNSLVVQKKSQNIIFKHQDYETKDFSVEPLAPYAVSNEGPHVSVLDINKDGLDDIFIPGGRFKSGTFFSQKISGEFEKIEQSDLKFYKKFEDIDQHFFDVDSDGDLDLITVYGGNESYTGYESSPILFINNMGKFKAMPDAFPNIKMNASVVITSDIDGDNDEDVFIGNNSISGAYGKSPKNYLFRNDGDGNFTEVTLDMAPDLYTVGQVYDAQFVDANSDGYEDLIVAGHYMPITIFLNDRKGNFIKKDIPSLEKTNGLWNCISIQDMDRDGDLDIVAGNWGLNSRLKASKEEPIQLYLSDFDDNGKVDPIVTYFYQGRETPIATKDELTKQIPGLNKKFLSYKAFSEADFNDYFLKEKIDQAEKKQVYMLETTFFENKGDLDFMAHSLSWETQISSVHDVLVHDVNADGYHDIILGGNTYEISTQLGRLDGSYGTILFNNKDGDFVSSKNSELKVDGAVRSIKAIKIKEEEYLLFGVNNDSIQLVKKIKE